MGVDEDWLFGITESGYSNDELNYEWIQHFDRYSAKRQHGAFRLLLIDSYTSHTTYEFVQYCNEHNIIPFACRSIQHIFFSHWTFVLFQPYKHYHSEAVENATRTGCTEFTKMEFLAALSSIRGKTFKSSSIVSAFRKTDLVPYDPQVVLAKLRENRPPEQPKTPTPEPPGSPLAITTPLTIRTLKRASCSRDIAYLQT